MEKIQDIFLKLTHQKNQWEAFISDQDLQIPDDLERSTIDQTIGIYSQENGALLGTGSIANNVIKYVAVIREDVESGQRFNRIITELSNRLAQDGFQNIFVFTKPAYAKSFTYLGFKVLAQAGEGVLLEKGRPNIQDYLDGLPKLSGDRRAAIVMNANPFTLGHRYLVELASRENDQVLVFLVEEDRSIFRFDERLLLVESGLSDLENVKVATGGKYMVSFATFPAYFIKSREAVVRYQTQLDANLFARWLVPSLGLTSRYLGEEPFSPTTALYNKALKEELSDQIVIKVVQRAQASGQVISATEVRRAISENRIGTIKSLVPETTFNFIERDLATLQERMKGYRTSGN